jgi:hypothetical protein
VSHLLYQRSFGRNDYTHLNNLLCTKKIQKNPLSLNREDI